LARVARATPGVSPFGKKAAIKREEPGQARLEKKFERIIDEKRKARGASFQ